MEKIKPGTSAVEASVITFRAWANEIHLSKDEMAFISTELSTMKLCTLLYNL